MKKAPAVLLLIVGGAVGLTLITLMMMIAALIAAIMIPADKEWMLYVLLGLFVFLISYPFRYLYITFKKKYKVPLIVFAACLCLPSAAASIAVNLLYEPAEQSSLTLLLALWLFVTGVFTITLLIHTGIYEIKRKIDNPK